jgi:hypothetical protein
MPVTVMLAVPDAIVATPAKMLETPLVEATAVGSPVNHGALREEEVSGKELIANPFEI